MPVHSPLNAFSFDILLIEIGQEMKLLEHLKKILDHLYFGTRIYTAFLLVFPISIKCPSDVNIK
jgi:hypothetical protein